MRHRRHGPGFRLQSPQAAVGPRRQDLDRHVALQPQVARQVDRAHAADAQAPRQAELAGEQRRDSRGDVGRGHRSADGALLGRRRLPRPRARRVEQLQARQGQPAGRAERLQERQVDGADHAAVEAAAHHQHPEHVRPLTGHRHDHVGARLGDPGRFLGRQQGEHRRPPVRLDPHGPAGGLQQVDDGRLARTGARPGPAGR